MRHFMLCLCILCAWTHVVQARHRHAGALRYNELQEESLSYYQQALERMAHQKDSIQLPPSSPSPYLFRLFAPGTLYMSALQQQMGYADSTLQRPRHTLPSLGTIDDRQLQLVHLTNDWLSHAYISYPGLFSTTQQELQSGTRLRSELSTEIIEEVKLTDKLEEEKLELDIAPVLPVALKPNFWTFKGNSSLQFTQSYFSSNWYQGGEKNYTMVALINAEANYDNKQKVQWDNKFEAQLGFQSSENTKPKFRSTNNLLRLTSKIGYKAAAHWNYAGQIQLQTQPYLTYDKQGENITAAFISPLYARAALGMDWKVKTKKFEGSLYLAPFSYELIYVKRDALVERYNVNTSHHIRHNWGPNVTFNFNYVILPQVTWNSRVYWFSDFETTRIEWENTINFAINRYLASKVFFYPRFDDSSPKFRDEKNGSFWMFKQWLSLGLSYDF